MRVAKIFNDFPSAGAIEYRGLTDYGDTLKIHFDDENDREIVSVFQSVFCYRVMDEGDAIRFIAELGGVFDVNPFLFRLEQSDFIKWFCAESFKEESTVRHTCLLTANHIIDVISNEDPFVSMNG